MQGAIKRDAHEFGLHVRQGGWRLGLLVARNVEKGIGTGGGGTDGSHRRKREGEKVSAAEFARLSGTSADRVLRYLVAWNNAADAGHVKHGDELAPGVADEGIDVESLPDWADFYPPQYADRMRRAGQQAARERPEEIADALRRAPEAAATVVVNVLKDEAVRAAIVSTPKGRAAADKLRTTFGDADQRVSVVGAGPEERELDGPLFRAAIALHRARTLMDTNGVRSIVDVGQVREALEQMADDVAALVAGVNEHAEAKS